MDRTAEYFEVAEATARVVRRPKEEVKQLQSARLLRPVRHKSEFARAAMACAQEITELLAFLAASRRDYLQPGRSSELQKDKVEEEVGLFSKACNRRVSLLQEGVTAMKGAGNATPQAVAHRQGVVSRLITRVLILTEALAEASQQFDRLREARLRARRDGRRRGGRPAAASARDPAAAGAGAGGEGGARPSHTQAVEGLPPERLAAMAEENAALLGELQSLSKQAHSVERTVADIAALNSMFSEAVLKQAAQVEGLYLDALAASSHAEAGNTHLRRAMQLNSSTRIYILLVFGIAIFGMLFLDRYSSRFGPV
eukprot:jgi/Tetstr1/461132/TSEL_006271.t1